MKVVVNYKGNITEFRDVYAVIDNPSTVTIDFWKHNSIDLEKSNIEGMDIII